MQIRQIDIPGSIYPLKKLSFSCSPICLSELVATVAGDGSTATGSTLVILYFII